LFVPGVGIDPVEPIEHAPSPAREARAPSIRGRALALIAAVADRVRDAGPADVASKPDAEHRERIGGDPRGRVAEQPGGSTPGLDLSQVSMIGLADLGPDSGLQLVELARECVDV